MERHKKVLKVGRPNGTIIVPGHLKIMNPNRRKKRY